MSSHPCCYNKLVLFEQGTTLRGLFSTFSSADVGAETLKIGTVEGPIPLVSWNPQPLSRYTTVRCFRPTTVSDGICFQ